jgi:hypothetical protein
MSSRQPLVWGTVARRFTYCLLIVLSTPFAVSRYAVATTEAGFDLGFGFRVAEIAMPTGPKAWERYAQYRVLFYKSTELGIYDSYSIAPSGRYLIFQDAPTESIILFTRATGKRQIVAKRPQSLAKDYSWRVKKYSWNEEQHQAIVLIGNKSSVRISLAPR